MLSRWLRRLSVQRRIIGGFLIVLLFSALSSLLIVTNQTFLVDRLQQVTNVETRGDRLLLLASARVESSRVNLARFVQNLTPSPYESRDDIQQAADLLAEARELTTSTVQATEIDLILTALNGYSALIDSVEGEIQEAGSESASRSIFSAYRLGNDIGQRIEQTVLDSEVRLAQTNTAVFNEARNRFLIYLAGSVILLVVSLLMARIVERSIVRPVEELRGGAEAFSQGQLEAAIPVTGSDELSVLATTFNDMTGQLGEMVDTLEQRVAERTNDLALAAEVGRRVSQIRAIDELLAEAARLIHSRFDLYHTQIYLNDDGELVLKAGTGEAGETLLAQSHRLTIGEGSINGMAADSQETLIVSDTAVDPLFRPNPLLPDTRSEMAIPLLAAGQVVGVLDLQSKQPGTFSEETLPAFETLAGQLAVAIENADLFTVREEAEEALRESQEKYMDLVEGLPLGIYSNTPGAQGKMLEANRAMVDIFEADSKESFLAASVASSYQHPDQFQDLNNQLLEHGIAEDIEIEMVTRRGKSFWGAVTAVKKEDASGQTYYDGFIQDVTARKQAEILLNKRAQELALLNELGRKADETPAIADYLTWVVQQIPPAMDHAEHCLAAITYQDQVYGNSQAIDTSRQIVEGLSIGGEAVGRIYIAYTEDFPFEDSDSALIGGVGRRVSTYLENRQLFSQVQSHLEKLQIVSDVSMTAATTLDTHDLLQNVSDRTKAGFNLYHASIFLLNDMDDELVLTAGAGEVGRQMTATDLRIPMDKQKSLAVRAAQTRQGVVVNDVQADPGFLPNPLLPETKAEVAVPMIAGETVLGVLDVQAAAVNAFSDVDVHVFMTLAAQVAAALQNANQHEQTQSALDELNSLQRTLTREGWQTFMMNRERPIQGFVADKKALRPITRNGDQQKTIDAVVGVETLTGDAAAVVTPMQVYGETIGGLGVRDSSGRPLDEDQMAILEAISSQVAEALERARLTEQTEMALAETEEQARRRALLNQLSEQLTRTQQIDKIYDIVTESALEILGGDRVTLGLLTEDQKGIQVVALYGRPGSVPVGTVQPVAQTQTQKVIKGRRPILINDDSPKGKSDVVSAIIAPLITSGGVIGAINISSKTAGQFDASDSDMAMQISSIMSAVLENRQLFTQMQERAEELALINRVVSSVAATLDVAESLQIVASELARAVNVEEVAIALMDEGGDKLTVVAENYNPEKTNSSLGFVIPLAGNALTQKVLETRKLLTVSDAQNNPLTALVHDGMRMRGVETLHLFPMIAGNTVIGTVGIDILEKDKILTDQELQLAQTLVYQAATAVQNARLFAESQEHAEELGVLNEMGRTLTTRLDLDSILVDTHRYVTQLLDANDMYIALYDEEADEVDIKIFGEGEKAPQSALRRRAGNGVTELVLRSRQPLLIKENIEQVAQEYGFDLIGRSSASWLGVPMTVGDKVLGVVAVQDFERTYAFNEHQEDLLLALSSQVAIAIENVRLFNLEQTRAKRERLLREITERVRRSADVDTIMRTAVQEVGRALGRRTYLYMGQPESEPEA